MTERESPYLWSTTAAINASVDPSINFAEFQLPSTLNNSGRSVMAALGRLLKDTNGSITSGGSANAYTLTINGTQAAYADGQKYSFKANFSNTGTATLNVTNADGTAIGVKAIRVVTASGELALPANAIRSGGRYLLQYDTAANSAAGAFILINPNPSSLVSPTITDADGNAVVIYFDCDTTGATDASTALQAKIAILEAGKGGIIQLPPGIIRLDSGVDFVKGSVIVRGTGWEDYSGSHGQFTTLSTQRGTQGTYVYQTSGSFSPFRVANTANHVEFRDIAFIQSQPADAGGWAPTTYQACIHFTNTGTNGGTGHVENCLFWGVYAGVRIGNATGNAGAVTGDRVFGFCFAYCWKIEYAVDAVKLTNFHFWNGYLQALNNIQAYAYLNASAIICVRADNPIISNGLILGFKDGILFEATTGNGVTSNFKLSNIDCDVNVNGIRSIGNGIIGEASNVTTNNASIAGSYGVYISDNSGTYSFANLKTANSGLNGIKLVGGGSSLAVSNLRVIGYNQDSSGSSTVHAVSAASGDTVTVAGEFVTSGGGSSGATGGSGTFNLGLSSMALAPYAVGDILYASSASRLSKLSDVATGNVLLSGGVTTAPAYGKVTFGHMSATANRLFGTGGTTSGVEVTVNSPLSLSGGALSIGFGTGVGTFLATPTSANLAAAVTDETGSGLLVFGTAPAISNPTITTAFTATGLVTNASLANMANGTVKGRSTAGAGVPEDIVLAALLQNYLTGLGLTYASTTTFTVAAGIAADSTNAVMMPLASALTKSTSAWAVGSGNGGIDTGTIANTTWYHVWLIRRSDTGVMDVLFSTSATAPTMPTNYDAKRRVGMVLTDGSAHFVQWVQDGDRFRWSTPVAAFATVTNPGTSAVTRTLAGIPTGVRVQADIVVAADGIADQPGGVYVSDLSVADVAADGTTFTIDVYNGSGSINVVGAPHSVMTNTSAQVRTRLQLSGASTHLNITVLGWADRRGRDG